MTKIAKIENVDDPNKAGRFQVRILPEMINMPIEDLPWAAAYNNWFGTSNGACEHKVPDVGTFVRVLIEDWPLLKRIRYISDDYVEGLYSYNQTDFEQIEELSEQTYPQPFFKKYKDGTIVFHNSNTGEHGTLFEDGSYIIRTSDGSFITNSKNSGQKLYNNNGFIELLSNGKISLNGDEKNLVTHKELNDALQNVINALNLHTHLNVTSGTSSSGVPSTPLTLDLSQCKAESVLTI